MDRLDRWAEPAQTVLVVWIVRRMAHALRLQYIATAIVHHEESFVQLHRPICNGSQAGNGSATVTGRISSLYRDCISISYIIKKHQYNTHGTNRRVCYVVLSQQDWHDHSVTVYVSDAYYVMAK